MEIERYLKEVPSVEASAVIADRIVGKPYLEIDFDRKKIARYGLTIREVQDVVEVAIGGRRITTTVEGRERFPVRVRYMRELRNEIETINKILVPAKDGSHIPLAQVAEIRYVRGPQVIKSEDTFLLGYVLFDMKPGKAEVNVVEDCQRYLQEKIDSGEFVLPPGVSYTFAGNYENQIRSQKTLMVVLPLALFIIFIILYFQFRSVSSRRRSSSAASPSPGRAAFIMLWLYGQPWFLDFTAFGTDMQTLFQIHPINLSVAIWVGFLALFGIASDDGVVIATYLDQSFFRHRITTSAEARQATLAAGLAPRPSLLDDDRHDDPGAASRADVHRPRLGHHGPDGHPQLRRHVDRDHDDARRPRALLLGPGMEAQIRHRGSTLRGTRSSLRVNAARPGNRGLAAFVVTEPCQLLKSTRRRLPIHVRIPRRRTLLIHRGQAGAPRQRSPARWIQQWHEKHEEPQFSATRLCHCWSQRAEGVPSTFARSR